MYLSKIYSNYSLNFDFAHNYMAILEYIIIFLYFYINHLLTTRFLYRSLA